MDSKGYYKTLGLNEDATQEQVKKQYRKLAQQWHPDKHQDKSTQEEAEQQFRGISEAYAVLSDTKLREAYDNPNLAEQPYNPAQDPRSDPMSILNQIIGARMRQQHQRPQEDIFPSLNIGLKLTLEEFHNGVKKKIRYQRFEPCVSCKGTGSRTQKSSTCSICNGTGSITTTQQNSPMGIMMMQTPCYSCSGTGIQIDDPCPYCQARKYEKKDHDLDITIPIGAYPGDEFIFNEGHVNAKTKRAGQVRVRALDTDHMNFYRGNRYDLMIDQELDLFEALLGTKLEITGIDNKKINIKVSPRREHQSQIKLSKQGLNTRFKQRGDLFINIKTKFPTLSKEEQETIKELWDNRNGN